VTAAGVTPCGARVIDSHRFASFPVVFRSLADLDRPFVQRRLFDGSRAVGFGAS
jgi:hypothetical protein